MTASRPVRYTPEAWPGMALPFSIPIFVYLPMGGMFTPRLVWTRLKPPAQQQPKRVIHAFYESAVFPGDASDFTGIAQVRYELVS